MTDALLASIARRAIGSAAGFRDGTVNADMAIAASATLIGDVARWHATRRECDLSVLTHLLAFLTGRWASACIAFAPEIKRGAWRRAVLAVIDLVDESLREAAA